MRQLHGTSVNESDLELTLAFHFRAAGLEAISEFMFHPKRKWRFDFAFPEQYLAVEVEGVKFVGRGKDTRLEGRHVSPRGFEEDAVKYNEAAILGWRVLRVTAKMIKSGEALQYVERALGTGSFSIVKL